MRPISTVDVSVEVLEWTPRWSLGSVAANFARMQVLLTLFDGDPDKWLELIERGEGSAEDDADVPFLAVMKQRIAEDPSFLQDMRRIIDAFAVRFSSHGTLQ
jgi:hypothetical protein